MSLANALRAAVAARKRVQVMEASASQNPEGDDEVGSNPSFASVGPSSKLSTSSSTPANPREEHCKVRCVATFVDARLTPTHEAVNVHVRADGLFVVTLTGGRLVRHIALPAVAEAVWLPPRRGSDDLRLRICVRGEHDLLLTRTVADDSHVHRRGGSKSKATAVTPAADSADGAALATITTITDDMKRAALGLFTIATSLRLASRSTGDFCPFTERNGTISAVDDPEATPEGLAALRAGADYPSITRRVHLRRRGGDKALPPNDHLTLAIWDTIEARLPPPLPVSAVTTWARWAIPDGGHVVMSGDVLLLRPVAFFDEENRPVIVERAARLRGAALAALSHSPTQRQVMSRAAKQVVEAGAPGIDGTEDDDAVPAAAIFTSSMLVIVYDPLRTVRLHLATLQAVVVHRTSLTKAPRRLELMFATADASCTVDFALGLTPYSDFDDRGSGKGSDDSIAKNANNSGDNEATFNSSVVADVIISLCNRMGIDVKVTQRSQGPNNKTTAAAPSAAASPTAKGSAAAAKQQNAMNASSSASGGLANTSFNSTGAVPHHHGQGKRRKSSGGVAGDEETDTSDPGSSGSEEADPDSPRSPRIGLGATATLRLSQRRLLFSSSATEFAAAPTGPVSLFRQVSSTHQPPEEQDAVDDEMFARGANGSTGTHPYLAVDRNGANDVWGAVTMRGYKDIASRLLTVKPYRPLRLVPDRRVLPETYAKMFGGPATLLVRWVLRETTKKGKAVERFAVLLETAQSPDQSDGDASGNPSDDDFDDDTSASFDALTPSSTGMMTPVLSGETQPLSNASKTQRRRPRVGQLLLCDTAAKVHRSVDLASVCRINCVSSEDRVILYVCGERPVVLRPDGDRTRAPAPTLRDCRVTDLVTMIAATRGRRPSIVSAPREEVDTTAVTTLEQAQAWRRETLAAVAKADAEVRESRLASLRLAAKAAGTGAVRKDAQARQQRQTQQAVQQREAFEQVDGALRGRREVTFADPSSSSSALVTSSQSLVLSPSQVSPLAKRRPLLTTSGGASTLLTALHNDERVRRHVIEDNEQGVLRVLWMRHAVEIRKVVELELKAGAKVVWSLERRLRSTTTLDREEGAQRIVLVSKARRLMAPIRFAGTLLHLYAHEDTQRKQLAQDAEIVLFRLHRHAREQLEEKQNDEDTGQVQRRERENRRALRLLEERTWFTELEAPAQHGVVQRALFAASNAHATRMHDRFRVMTQAITRLGKGAALSSALTSMFVDEATSRASLVREWIAGVQSARFGLQRACVLALHLHFKEHLLQSEAEVRQRLVVEGAASCHRAATASTQRLAREQLAARYDLQNAALRGRAELQARMLSSHVDSLLWHSLRGVALTEASARRTLQSTLDIAFAENLRETRARSTVYLSQAAGFRAISGEFVDTLPRPSATIQLFPGESPVSRRVRALTEVRHMQHRSYVRVAASAGGNSTGATAAAKNDLSPATSFVWDEPTCVDVVPDHTDRAVLLAEELRALQDSEEPARVRIEADQLHARASFPRQLAALAAVASSGPSSPRRRLTVVSPSSFAASPSQSFASLSERRIRSPQEASPSRNADVETPQPVSPPPPPTPWIRIGSREVRRCPHAALPQTPKSAHWSACSRRRGSSR
jgi:hypothetical protein